MATSLALIEIPVINSPMAEPQRHFRFRDGGVTSDMVEARRESVCFIPIASPRKKGKSRLYFEAEWTNNRIEPCKFINNDLPASNSKFKAPALRHKPV